MLAHALVVALAVQAVPPELGPIIAEADQLVRTNPGWGSKWVETIEKGSTKARAYLAGIPEADFCFWLEGLDFLFDLTLNRFTGTIARDEGVTIRTHEARAKLQALKDRLEDLRRDRCNGPGGTSAREVWGKQLREKLQGKRWRSRDRDLPAYAGKPGLVPPARAKEARQPVVVYGALTLLLLATPLPGDEVVTLAMLSEALAL